MHFCEKTCGWTLQNIAPNGVLVLSDTFNEHCKSSQQPTVSNTRLALWVGLKHRPSISTPKASQRPGHKRLPSTRRMCDF